MKKLLSLPPNPVRQFHDLTHLPKDAYFCTSDPENHRLGSGGGTVWLLQQCRAAEAPDAAFADWLGREKRLLLHAGGQSRRLPAYAAGGKSLTPIPVFRWARGQRIDQTLLDLQVPLYEKMLEKAPSHIHTLIAGGDVLLRATQPLQELPEADVICYGLWASPEQIAHHGVFMIDRNRPDELDFMLQKPSTEEQAALMQTHMALIDVGVWLLSDRAVAYLTQKSDRRSQQASASNEVPRAEDLQYYDLYSDFGRALGAHPSQPEADLPPLKVAIVPLPGGEFYHYGTGPDMLTSSIALQALVKDQRQILQRGVKQRASVFTQNTLMANPCTPDNEYIWIENAYLGADWQLSRHHILTGIPQNQWQVKLPEGICIDFVPIGEKDYALRVYGYDDAFRGNLAAHETTYLGRPFADWAAARGLSLSDFKQTNDLQTADLFPVSSDLDELERLFHWIVTGQGDERATFLRLPRLSADDLMIKANLKRLFAQRESLRQQNLPQLAANWRKSVFYQLDLKDVAAKYAAAQLPLPDALPDDAPSGLLMQDAMFRSEALRTTDRATADHYSAEAFGRLRDGMTEEVRQQTCLPRRTTFADQIVWARSAVRIDLAGGWTDTPPYSLMNGGNVVNVAIEMNGQQPLQVYVRPCPEPLIRCRSIDLGASVTIETFEALRTYDAVGDPFSIPKAALALCGFLPEFCSETYPTLRHQLEAFGCGLELTLLAAIPAGSGLGTSSILAATVLGALSNCCGLGWDKNEICNRTLILEQLLTTGGGWQDQYGGVLRGVKLLQTEAGFNQNAVARYLPTDLFTAPEYSACHLLYYTGITRTAKHILAEIVRGMFLNANQHLALLDEMKAHATALFESIQLGDFERYGRLVRTTWEQNKALDKGTSPAAISALADQIDDLCLGYKLPGAGGGGFMYMVAKDPEAAMRIRRTLTANPLTENSRFVDLSISEKGLQISRS